MKRFADIFLALFAALVALVGIWFFFIHDDPVVNQPIATVREAVDILRANALAASLVDWPTATKRAEITATATGRRSALDNALYALVAELQDSHSHYISPAKAKALHAAPRDQASTTSLFDIQGGRGDIPIVRIHAFASVNDLAVAQAASQLNAALMKVRAPFSCGLVIDLSDNVGGNMWPMLNGLYSVVPPMALGMR